MKRLLKRLPRPLRTFARFVRHYKLFALATTTVIIGLILQLSDQKTASHWLLGVVSIIAALPLLWDMVKDLRSGKYGIDILAITAIIVSVLLKEYWAGIVVVLMLTGGEALEDNAEHRAQSELDALLDHAPRKALVVRKGKTTSVPVAELKVGDKVIIKTGDAVPADALVLDGSANFDEASLTGESLPVSKSIDDTLLSGSINLDGEIIAKVTATAADSQYEQIIKLVRNAANTQAPFTRLAERYSLPFTFAAYALGFGVWALTGDAIRFLEVIIVATPCPLLLAAPIALISGMARASRYGIIVKTGSSLEKLAQARTIAFDKTGTLTQGLLSVDTVTAFGTHKKADVLQLAASLEQSSHHVVAQAIITQAASQKLKLTKGKHVREIAGQGLQAVIKGKQVLVGRLSLLTNNEVVVPAGFKATSVKQTAVYVAHDGELVGYITLKDELRPETADTLDQLRAQGLRNMLMVTGDSSSTAKAIAKQLGIDDVHAEALPADKLHVLAAIKARPLVFVGDGVNDAPVLTSSDVGIALGARGSTAASESADMVIMTDDISRIAVAHYIAKRTFSIARQSILAGIGLSLILMIVFATGKFSPLYGAIIQEVVDVVVIVNALRAHYIKV